MILSELSVSLFLMIKWLWRFNLLMNMWLQLMILLLLLHILLVWIFFLFTFLLMNLLCDINQMGGKQDFRVLIAQGVMTAIMGERVDSGHWLQIVVQVSGLPQRQVSLRHHLISLWDDLMQHHFVVDWVTFLALEKYLQGPWVFWVASLSISSFVANQALAWFYRLINWENSFRWLGSVNVAHSIWNLFWIIIVKWHLHNLLLSTR